VHLSFQHTTAVVEAPECPAFLAALRSAAPDWPFGPCGPVAEPAARVRRHGDAYVILTPGEPDIEASAVAAACSMVCDVALAFADERPDQLSLHCGSVLLGGRLVIFPSSSHAGKSTLVGRLAAGGHRVFGDDMLLIDRDDRHGIALGVAPRLRLPLPEAAAPGFVAFVQNHARARDHRYLYLGLPDRGLARRGERAPLGAVVLLDRRDGASATLRHAPRNAVLQTLLRQNVTLGGDAGDILARAHAMMERLPCLMLTFGDLEEASALLGARFASWPLALDDLGHAPAYSLTAAEAAVIAAEDRDAPDGPLSPRHDRHERLIRRAGVEMRRAGGEAFLAGGPDGSIFQLNAIGTGLWNLLAEPVSAAEATETLCAAFPDVAPGRIADDVDAVFDAFVRAGLAVAAQTD
jgi:hypothetical protein